MYRALPNFSLILLLLIVAACADKKTTPEASSSSQLQSPNQSEGATPSATNPPILAPAKSLVSMPPGPYKIARTELAERLSQTQEGKPLHWMQLGELDVLSEEIGEVYKSRGKSYVSFKAELRAKQNCLVDWRVELIAGPTGRGKSLAQIQGLQPTTKGETLWVSGVTEVSDKDLPDLASASAGYWSVCGLKMPSPSVHQFKIASATAKEIKLADREIHHTAFSISGRAPANQRCFVELVAEDRDKRGYTLNRDFTSFSISSHKEIHAGLIRRTTFEGGAGKDYEDLATQKNAYLRNMHCVSAKTLPTPKVQGIEISDLTLHANTSEPKSAEHLARQSFGHGATLHNRSGKDCSFHLRYRILDKDGLPLNRTSIFSEQIHLKKGATIKYQQTQERLYVWLDHREEIGSLSVESALPVDDCKAFDPTKALEN